MGAVRPLPVDTLSTNASSPAVSLSGQAVTGGVYGAGDWETSTGDEAMSDKTGGVEKANRMARAARAQAASLARAAAEMGAVPAPRAAGPMRPSAHAASGSSPPGPCVSRSRPYAISPSAVEVDDQRGAVGGRAFGWRVHSRIGDRHYASAKL